MFWKISFIFFIADLFRDLDILFLKKGKTKKPLHRHQESAGALLSLQNDVLCNGFEIQRRDCFAPKYLLTVPKRIEWWVTVFSLSIPPALGGFATSQSYIVFSCNPLFEGIILYHKTCRKSRILRWVLNNFRICGNNTLLKCNKGAAFLRRLLQNYSNDACIKSLAELPKLIEFSNSSID